MYNQLISEEYSLNRIVFVHSGPMAFVEFPLNETASFLGANNHGKTSGLSALKLALLPEVNFKKCETKFGFRSKSGLHTGQISHKFYFPSDRSFIICEATNPSGPYCQILFRSNQDYGYGRWFVPVPYSDIKHWFWQVDSEANGGLGEPTNITQGELTKLAKTAGGELILDKAELRQALYARQSLGNHQTRYSLIPMGQKVSEGQVDALRALLHLAFESNDNKDESLKNAVATIIDRDLSARDDTIKVEFDKIALEYESLKAKESHIHRREQLLPQWLQLKPEWERYKTGLDTWVQQLAHASDSIAFHRDSQAERTHTARQAYDRAKEAAQIAKRTLNDTRAAHQETKGELKVLSNALNEAKAEKDQLMELRQSYAVLNLDDEGIAHEIESAPRDGIDALIERLDAAQSRENAIARMEKLHRQRQDLQEKAKRLDGLLRAEQKPMLGQLQEDTASLYASLHPDFKSLPRTGETDALEAMEALAAHFATPQGQRATFAGSEMPTLQIESYSPGATRAEWEHEREEVRSEIRVRDKELRELQSASKDDEETRQANAAQLKADLDKARYERKIARGGEDIIDTYNRKSREHDEVQARFDELEAQVSEQIETDATAREMAETAVRDLESEEKKHALLNNLTETANRMIQHRGQGEVDAYRGASENDALSIEAAQTQLTRLETDVQHLDDLRSTVRDRLAAMDREGIKTPHSGGLYQVSWPRSEMQAHMDELAAQFEHLEAERQSLRNSIESHNRETSTQIEFINHMAAGIESFERELNEHFQEVQISNLSEIKVIIKTHERYDRLRSELNTQSREANDSLMDEAFYSRLQRFVEEHLSATNGDLDLTRIISGIDYTFVVNGVRETTGQSNGTTGMVIAVLLTFLMRRIAVSDIALRMPIVFDEIGSLQKSNIQALRDVVENRGFVLLVANPENNGNLASVISRWHNLSLASLKSHDPVNNKCQALYVEGREQLVRTDGPANAYSEPVEG